MAASALWRIRPKMPKGCSDLMTGLPVQHEAITAGGMETMSFTGCSLALLSRRSSPSHTAASGLVPGHGDDVQGLRLC